MLSHDTGSQIKNIVGGNVIEGGEDTCTTIRNHLCAGFATSTTVKTDFEGKLLIKKEQALVLEAFSKKTIYGLLPYRPKAFILQRAGRRCEAGIFAGINSDLMGRFG